MEEVSIYRQKGSTLSQGMTCLVHLINKIIGFRFLIILKLLFVASLQLFPMLKELIVAPEEERVAIKDRIGEGLVVLEEAFTKCSKGKTYFGGNDIGYLDIALGSCLQFVKGTEKLSGLKLVEEAKTPNLVGWAVSFMSNDAVKNVLPETDRMVEVLKRIQARAKAFPNRSWPYLPQ